MKKFVNAELVELNVEETAMGIYNPDLPDIDKEQVDGSILDETKANDPGYRGWFGTDDPYYGR